MREDVRLVDRDRGSRTIIASYKNAHSTFCEFVGDEEETAELAAGLRKKLSKPPRFFTPREVARLQGFPEEYLINWVSNAKQQWERSLSLSLSLSLSDANPFSNPSQAPAHF